MKVDLNTKALMRNAYRITADRRHTCLRIRVPGGHLAARHLILIQQIAEEFGNGTVHITIRQGFEIPGILFENIPAVNRALQPLLTALEVAIGVPLADTSAGYPAAGTRNISACIGNRVCQFANFDTTALAQRLEQIVFPNNDHVKIGVTGCPNDCIKAHMQDFGIIGQAAVEIEAERCIGCEACVTNCRKRVTDALTLQHNIAVRDAARCIGCGECVLKCPTGAWSRNPEKLFRLVVLGRTGKKNPRLAATFLEWASEAVILRVIGNVYAFIHQHIDRSLAKEHLGYIVDRVGYPAFRTALLDGVTLNPQAHVAEELEFFGYCYVTDPDRSNFKGY
jgi:anaerobic sulfite reductase subunit C